MEDLLRGCLSADNSVRSQAEQALKGVGRGSDVIDLLLQILHTSPDPAVGIFMSSVLLVKISTKF